MNHATAAVGVIPGALLSQTYLSRNLVDSRYLDSLRQLVQRCQRAECPDLLLVNGGMHALWHNVANHSVRGWHQAPSYTNAEHWPMLCKRA